MLKVALTGGIATGKSYVLARLKDRGVATIDADDIVHDALGAGSAVSRAIASEFGDAFLHADGSVNRRLLGVRVFEDTDARRRLEAIIHPVVWRAIDSWYGELAALFGVASIPLLYETGHEKDFDYVVVTACPAEVQLQRILERDRISEEQALQRIAAQLPVSWKVEQADFVIQTGGAKPETDRQVGELLAAIGRELPYQR